MKRITAKIDTYMCKKDNKEKGKFVDIGVIMSNDNGEFLMLNPTIDLSGVLMRQRLMAQKLNKKAGDSVMCSIWDNSQSQQQPQQDQQQNQQQQPPQGNGGFSDEFSDDIPF